MKAAIAQINSTIGDFEANTQKILDFAVKAREGGAECVFFPELALCAYPPMDLLDQNIFVELNTRALCELQRRLPKDLLCGVGYVKRNPRLSGKALVNAYGLLHNGGLIFEQTKTLLPTYDVFDEARNFEPASSWEIFEWQGERLGLAICEDVWRETETPGTLYVEDPVRRLLERGISVLIVPSASPFYAHKHDERLALARRIEKRGGIKIIYINAVGANDSIIFDGRSFFLSDGVLTSAAAFKEDILFCEAGSSSGHGGSLERASDSSRRQGGSLERASDSSGIWPQSGQIGADSAVCPSFKAQKCTHFCRQITEADAPKFEISGRECELDIIEDALVMGIREYMGKCGFTRAHLGLSGGIDSALTAYLAARAVGAENITAISMPSRFSSQGSKDDAALLAGNLGCRYEVLPIEPVFEAFLNTLSGVFAGRPFDIAEENLQARVRGALLMAFSNKWNSMLLTTGNKSELAMGYCTLYGDMNGALSPIGDLFKTEVFELCRRINERAGAELIPAAIIEKPPSAELRPNQKDEDSLPPYELLDKILRLYLFENLSAAEIAERGVDGALAESIVRGVARAEFKRRQAPPVLKVSPRAFGMGRRMPIARAVYEAKL